MSFIGGVFVLSVGACGNTYEHVLRAGRRLGIVSSLMFRRRLRRLGLAAGGAGVAALALAVGPASAAGPARPGLPCPRLNARARTQGVELLCVQIGGKLLWQPDNGPGKAQGPRAGTRCTRLNARARTSTENLVCIRHGKALVWEPAGGKGTPGSTANTGSPQPGNGTPPGGGGQVIAWSNDPSTGVWTPSSSPPACPAQPMLSAPADLAQVTAILYPGQVRGNSPNPPPGAPPPGFKPHGGFMFGNAQDNGATVKAALDGYVTDAARYLVDGEVQYMFDVVNPCGILVRYGHLLTLTSAFQAVADTLPQPTEGDSRTTEIAPGSVPVTKGEVLATRVGVTALLHNTFFDFGVFDLRTFNAASRQSGFLNLPDNDLSLGGHGVCWLRDWFPASDEATMNALPAGDGYAGKTSYYC